MVTVSASATLQGVTSTQMSTAAAQTSFKNAVATTAGVSASAVSIVSIVDASGSAGRHLLVGGVVVSFTVATTSASIATSVTNAITAAGNGNGAVAFVNALNTELAAQGAAVAVAGVTTTAVVQSSSTSLQPAASGAQPRKFKFTTGGMVLAVISLW